MSYVQGGVGVVSALPYFEKGKGREVEGRATSNGVVDSFVSASDRFRKSSLERGSGGAWSSTGALLAVR